MIEATELKKKLSIDTKQDYSCHPFKQQWDALFKNNPAMVPPPFYNGVLTPEFRKMKTYLMAKSRAIRTREMAVLMVTSCVSGEGVSTVAMNLATSFSLERNRVTILIDCAHTTTNITTQLGAEKLSGLMNYLQDNVALEDIVYTLPTPQLLFIPQGKQSPYITEYLESERMHDFIAAIKTKYPQAQVIIDAPPTYQHSESKIIAHYCDRIVLVNQLLKTPQSLLKQSLSAFERDKIAGIITNHVYS